jgi:hypothetical protein
MSSLSFVEKIQLEKLLQMGGGYVLDFNDRTYQQFIGESIGIDIFDEKYKEGTGSKAKRMRAFWTKEQDHVVGKLLNDLLKYIPHSASPPPDESLVLGCTAIVERLLRDSPAVQLGPLVFISYARPDLAAVNALVDLLKDAGLRTWFDKKDLKGGQDWEFEIRKHIADAAIFLVCLSTNAADRKGFYHRETRYAVEEAMKLPKGKVYILPVRLNDCPYPDDLRHLHTIDLFSPNSSYGLLSSVSAALKCGAVARAEAHAAFHNAIEQFNSAKPG